jgi:hypothetical protein
MKPTTFTSLRAWRRALERELRGRHCGSCGGSLDLSAHEVIMTGPDGRDYPHLACGTCIAEGLSGPEGQRRVIERARLRLAEAEGAA